MYTGKIKRTAILLSFTWISLLCISQDNIYYKDGTVQKAKVTEITLDRIKYKKFEILSGPVYEISKNDVYKIRYSNGFTDVLDASWSDTLSSEKDVNGIDTVGYCMIYLVNTYDQGAKLKFPVYLNGKHVLTIRNLERASIKLFSSGTVILEREPGKTSSPRLTLSIENGKCYGISIGHPFPYSPIRNKRFSLNVVTDRQDFLKYMDTEFNHPENVKKGCIYFVENYEDPLNEW